jgi:hypothetical protein
MPIGEPFRAIRSPRVRLGEDVTGESLSRLPCGASELTVLRERLCRPSAQSAVAAKYRGHDRNPTGLRSEGALAPGCRTRQKENSCFRQRRPDLQSLHNPVVDGNRAVFEEAPKRGHRHLDLGVEQDEETEQVDADPVAWMKKMNRCR